MSDLENLSNSASSTEEVATAWVILSRDGLDITLLLPGDHVREIHTETEWHRFVATPAEAKAAFAWFEKNWSSMWPDTYTNLIPLCIHAFLAGRRSLAVPIAASTK